MLFGTSDLEVDAKRWLDMIESLSDEVRLATIARIAYEASELLDCPICHPNK